MANGNRNKALQGVLSRPVGREARTCLRLSCHCPQLGVLWDGFGVEQTLHSRAPLLKSIPLPWDLSTVLTEGSSDCLTSPCADCSPVAVSRWELSSPGQDMAVFPKSLWEIRAGNALPALGEQLDPGAARRTFSFQGWLEHLWRMHPPAEAGSHSCKEGS